MENPSGNGRSRASGLCWVAVALALGLLVALNFAVSPDQGASTAAESLKQAGRVSPVAIGFLLAMFVVGIFGLQLAVKFFVDHGRELRASPKPRIQPAVLLISFLVYLVGMLVLDLIVGLSFTLLGFDPDSGFGSAAIVVLEILSMIGAFALGVSVLRVLTVYTDEDPAEIGTKTRASANLVAWGVGGYCAALPFLGASVVLSILLTRLLRHVSTPEHPITPMVTGGGAALVAAFVLAVVVAPVIEETFFRGMLYNALRANMGVWPAALLSGAIFAIIHPQLPAGFPPLMVLGTLLAILREKTGSLIPSMVCHAINNTVALVFVLLVL